jgi:hypothetical protein
MRGSVEQATARIFPPFRLPFGESLAPRNAPTGGAALCFVCGCGRFDTAVYPYCLVAARRASHHDSFPLKAGLRTLIGCGLGRCEGAPRKQSPFSSPMQQADFENVLPSPVVHASGRSSPGWTTADADLQKTKPHISRGRIAAGSASAATSAA